MSLRITLVLTFLALSLVIYQRDTVVLKETIRESRSILNHNRDLIEPHVGKLSDYRMPSNASGCPISQSMAFLNFEKKINTYSFTYYNWYHFDLEFVDLGYESYFQMRTFSQDYTHQGFTQRIGFNLDQSFYPGGKVQIANNTCCCPSKDKAMNFNFNKSGFQLAVRQYTIRNSSNQRHDGNKYGRFWYYTPNKSIDEPQNQNHQTDFTITTFNLTYKSEQLNVEANLTHVMKHNQCISFVEPETNVFKHKCYAGYGDGKIFLDRKIKHQYLSSHNKWVKSSYNLDNNRTRTIFEGIRSTKRIASAAQKSMFPVTNWHWKHLRASMQCFSKPEYYKKLQNIEKERLIGLHLGRRLDISKQNSEEVQEDFIFVNGKIHAIDNAEYKIDQRYPLHKNITFKAKPNPKNQNKPSFNIDFKVISTEKKRMHWLFKNRNQLRSWGYWSGWISEGIKGENVSFYNISGYIDTTHSFY